MALDLRGGRRRQRGGERQVVHQAAQFWSKSRNRSTARSSRALSIASFASRKACSWAAYLEVGFDGVAVRGLAAALETLADVEGALGLIQSPLGGGVLALGNEERVVGPGQRLAARPRRATCGLGLWPLTSAAWARLIAGLR